MTKFGTAAKTQEQYLKVIQKLDSLEYMLYVINIILFAAIGFTLGIIVL